MNVVRQDSIGVANTVCVTGGEYDYLYYNQDNQHDYEFSRPFDADYYVSFKIYNVLTFLGSNLPCSKSNFTANSITVSFLDEVNNVLDSFKVTNEDSFYQIRLIGIEANTKYKIRVEVDELEFGIAWYELKIISTDFLKENHKKALVALYNNTGGANWNVPWDISKPSANWHGVDRIGNIGFNQFTDFSNGYLNLNVNGLSLWQNNLTGSLPNEIGLLTSIRFLSLPVNNLQGGIPLSIGGLVNLETLWLAQNNLSGEIPKEIKNLINLKTLWLHNNNITGAIPSEIGSLINLEQLGLNDNAFNGNIPFTMGNLSKLTSLSLNRNSLTGSIPSELSNLSSLEDLWLFDNSLNGNIPAELGSLFKLENLYFSNNNFSGTIPDSFRHLSNLKKLFLNNNNLSGEIGNFIGDMESLEVLEISNNNFNGTIPIELGNLVNLEDLFLGGNNLEGSVPEEVFSLVNLESLGLNDNNLEGVISNQLVSLENLEFLNLSNNKFEGEIPSDIGQLNKLRRLFLGDNLLSGSIPESISSIENLEQLILKKNKFNGNIPDLSGSQIPSFFGYLDISLNDYIFSDLEPQFDFLKNNIGTFVYAPMNPFNQPQNIPLVLGQTITLNASFSSLSGKSREAKGVNNEYQWYKDGILIDGAVNESYIIENAVNEDAGEYICKVTNSSIPDLILESNPIIIESSLGTEEIIKNDIKIYPNPASNILVVESKNYPVRSVSFFNVLGESVKQVNDNFTRIDVSSLSNGIYFLKIKTDLVQVSKKLVVKTNRH